MREAFARLLREVTIVALALGIAVGWTLIGLANGVSSLVTGLLTEYSDPAQIFEGAPLSWRIGDRVLTLYPLVEGLVELGVVLMVAWFVLRRSAGSVEGATQPPGRPGEGTDTGH